MLLARGGEVNDPFWGTHRPNARQFGRASGNQPITIETGALTSVKARSPVGGGTVPSAGAALTESSW
jgi:hypothetical protein